MAGPGSAAPAPAQDALTPFERRWMTVFLSVIVASTAWFGWTGTDWHDWKSVVLNWVVQPVSSVTGVICVVLSAKGKLSNWTWGLANSVAYGLVAWQSGYYGDWLLNWFFFVPTQFLIFAAWRRNLRAKTTIVHMRGLRWRLVPVFALACVATVAFAYFLVGVDNFFTQAMKRSSTFYGNLGRVSSQPLLGPLLDSSTVICQVVGQALMILMFAEQWYFWLAANVVTLFIWGTVIATDPTSRATSIPTFVMWLAFLANCVYGAGTWFRSTRVRS